MAEVAPGFLEQRLIEVSNLVRHGLREALSALELGDFAIAQRVIEADDEVDRLCLALDRDAEILLVGRVVPAHGIALVLASTRIARNLERMADQCVTIAKLVQAGGNNEPGADDVRRTLDEMGRRGERMLEAATDALTHRDAERAQQLEQLDNLVDDLNRNVVEQVLAIGGDHARREWGLRMVLAARALERIADNAVDIAEQASYVVTGELREFSDASHPEDQSGNQSGEAA
jgi:phosphate transport system protein